MDWGRVNSNLDSLQVIKSANNSRNPSVSSFNPRPKSITFQEPTLMAPDGTDSVGSETKTLFHQLGSRPSITLTTVDDKPPTGQHSIGYFNFAADTSANIIRSSLQEVNRSLSNTGNTGRSDGAEGSAAATQGGHTSARSESSSSEESNSSISSHIDFNFDVMDIELDTSDTDFPVRTLQPTIVPMVSAAAHRKDSEEETEMSTYL